ncbi:hypothetical protein HIM_04162 [Hirsutella minnesotensis 3608]|uniref:Uncharacterized protein n=1 Tax=Hirsutella minnesotensis 3608 TaxID=1043627 RepID=A0A0F7ZVD7_9HYPO|nr:hypothetical protein HIM_04162 [Hirsutella minnesotensis 3608]
MSAATSALAGRERLSVTTAIIGIVTLPVMEKIADLNIPTNAHTPALNHALLEIKQCRATVHLLYKTFSAFEAGRLPYPERAAWISVDDLIALLTDTVLSLSDVQAICEELDAQRRSGAQVDQETSASVDQKMDALCSRIRWLSLSINIMNTILNCSGEADAESARIALNRRMARLLLSNSAISMRLRLFYSAYYARVAQRNPLPHYTPPESRPLPSSASESLVSAHEQQARAQSPYSGYTLADVPVMSIVALPLLTGELRDGHEYYTAAYARRAGRDLGNMICLAEDQSGLLGAIRSRPSAENGGSETSTDSSNRGATADNAPPASKATRFGRIARVRRRWRWRT